MAFVSTPHLPSKLGRRRVDPFTVSKSVNLVILQLGLSLGWQIPIVHAWEGVCRHPEFEKEGEPLPPELVDRSLESLVCCHYSRYLGVTCAT